MGSDLYIWMVQEFDMHGTKIVHADRPIVPSPSGLKFDSLAQLDVLAFQGLDVGAVLSSSSNTPA